MESVVEGDWSKHTTEPRQVDVLIVGAGFAGLYMLHRARRAGLTAVVLEAAAGIGGTWYHNRYPGARCDIESLDYSYSFDEDLQQEWHWSERYASQPEILRYINHVADRFNLRPDIILNTRVSAAEFVESDSEWRLTTASGDIFTGQFCVMACGVLSAAQVPLLPGLDAFQGEWYHTGAWPHDDVDFTGKRVGVIGTGSSGTQLIPIVAEQARELIVFQRTANFCMPAQNVPLDPAVERAWKAHYPERRAFARSSSFGHNQLSNPLNGRDATPEKRQEEFERRWQLGGLYMMRAFKDILTDAAVNEDAIQFVHSKIDEIVDDPETAELLKPKDLYIGTKRLCSGTGYYETYNRDNVRLVDVKSYPLREVTATGLRTDVADYDLDVIVFATGFDAMTGSILRIDPRGRDGHALHEHWANGPRTYLGVMTSGFPNLFLIAGAGSPSVFSNMVNSIEQHIDWVASAIEDVRRDGIRTIEAMPDAEERWVTHVNELAEQTLYRHARNTWFYGANTPGKPVVFMPYLGGVGNYAATIEGVADAGYRGFLLDGVERPEPTAQNPDKYESTIQ